MYLSQSIEYVEENASMRDMCNNQPALLRHEQSMVTRKISNAHSLEKASTEGGGSGMFFVRSFTRDDLTNKSDSETQSSRDSSTTRVQEREKRNLIRRRISSMSDIEKKLSGKRFDEPIQNKPTVHLEGLLIKKKSHLNDDDSFSSLSYGVHDEDEDSLESCDQVGYCNLKSSNMSEMEMCLQQPEQGIITPMTDDLSDVSAKILKVYETQTNEKVENGLIQQRNLEKGTFITRQVSVQDTVKIMNRICYICQTSFFIGGFVCPCNFCGMFFHRECLIRWFNHRPTCPFCSRPVICTSEFAGSN